MAINQNATLQKRQYQIKAVYFKVRSLQKKPKNRYQMESKAAEKRRAKEEVKAKKLGRRKKVSIIKH
ncbi:hypothetical protein BHC44_01465 [Snodgrassella alvi]|nr:hypothetical protein BHC44_01465 [Snodgrassella alvi]